MLKSLVAYLYARWFPAAPVKQARKSLAGAKAAFNKLMAEGKPAEPYVYPIQAPTLMPGVLPEGKEALVAMDSASYGAFNQYNNTQGFPGYPYLSQLALRAEYRAFAGALSTELTREFIELTSTDESGDDTKERIKKIETELQRLNIRGVMQKAAEHDCYFGSCHIFIDIDGADRTTALVLDKRTIRPNSLVRVTPVEPIWTTPSAYDALDPTTPSFYKPSAWYMLGKEVHASRLATVITRQLPDILKPAFNFGGISLSQLAEPYVDNWLRTRQSVSDLLNNFSITALATSMDQVLSGEDDDAATNLFARAMLFTATRSNKGLMLLDKEREEIIQTNTPLSGLHELQAQSQEQMCSVSRMPSIILTGISPGGLNASSDSEIRVFYDWIAAQQEAYWREPLDTIIKVIQISMFGDIDPHIGFKFVPLYQMSADEEADIRLKNSQSDVAYINAGVLDPQEPRERLARDPNSGYNGLDTSAVIVPPVEPTEEKEPAMDAKFEENKHPRADNGQFGSGGGDPAIVNVPLAKRGDIDAQLDRYKKQQEVIAKTKRKETAQETRENKALAKSLLAEHQAAMLDKHSAKFGEKELRGIFDQWAKWEPKKLIAFVDKFINEQAT